LDCSRLSCPSLPMGEKRICREYFSEFTFGLSVSGIQTQLAPTREPCFRTRFCNYTLSTESVVGSGTARIRSDFAAGGSTFRSDDNQCSERGLEALKLQGRKPPIAWRSIMSELKLHPRSRVRRETFLRHEHYPAGRSPRLNSQNSQAILWAGRAACAER
jgi:hypothetical protein